MEHAVAAADEQAPLGHGRRGPQPSAGVELPPHGAVIRCREELVPMVREALGPRPSLSVEASADAGSGFTAMGQHGSVRIDATLETRLERLADTLAIEIHEQVKER